MMKALRRVSILAMVAILATGGVAGLESFETLAAATVAMTGALPSGIASAVRTRGGPGLSGISTSCGVTSRGGMGITGDCT